MILFVKKSKTVFYERQKLVRCLRLETIRISNSSGLNIIDDALSELLLPRLIYYLTII